ncbi:methyltransferase (TIGR00027 family) [Saccharopolyspora erythraea NRRL 2338]|uniref:Putative S-adenosyl-L-methionine-dependent methyltransferase SACE_1742 n=2 Tax=Saccharopolyspora erythraea TaxID=1836 RepID=Y1742_SACEN|nr:SAM-dependent methyltransferase [Saccharopolyspora erythraea]A4FAI5.1 RecName: Full=Putative S-adenosyl-L-methionine-dependent methyltransferase SACE_1742 [Saccharopolyspora erythraea NRRL 2338]EQD82785.1 SAM-dependent methyltransferase [Saccharopolyspora erythraea D]PFG94848.1 methyltransferase (TIGR00027 family) [Saccharopolyspora erythraea NRRL 2338]QRK91554.1 SAM-dependent methyltransferase [Saccharopolyspora erythraea]CAM01060.1 protein of unknown function Mtu_121 [Saccharopolyspora er
MSANEQWDIVSGVGITALAVAVARARESRRDDRLIDDPYAEPLIRAAQPPVPMSGDGGEAGALWHEMTDYVSVRSRFFDEWFARACAAGTRQAVVLASGLDTRAFRLEWPEGFRVFEIDQPKVLEFKDGTLAAEGVRASCERHAVAVDLRDDWASALVKAGFDPALPTAWLAEGLLPYLPPEAEANLLATVHDLSARGSRIAIESIALARSALLGADLDDTAREWGIDLKGLFSLEDRPDPGDVLAQRGWRVHRDPVGDLAAGFRRPLSDRAQQLGAAGEMVTAQRD